MDTRVLVLLLGSQFVGSLVIFDNSPEKDAECCIRDEWQGVIFIDYGAVYIDQDTLDTYYNGSMHVAYSIPENKFYYRLHLVEQSPLIPQPISANSTMLKDYAMGISYTVSNGKCQKDQIDKSMPKQCIPSDAKLLYRGEFGDDKRTIETYEFMTSDPDLPFRITTTVMRGVCTKAEKQLGFVLKKGAIVIGTNATHLCAVSPRECEPFHASYFTPSASGSGTMYTLNVMDIEPLASKEVFKVPEECRHLQ